MALNRTGELHDPAALLSGMTRYPLNRRLGDPQRRYGGFWRRLIFYLPGIEAWIVQSVA